MKNRLTDEVFERITISDEIKEYRGDEIKKDARMFDLLVDYFKFTYYKEFNELIESDKPIILSVNNIRTTIGLFLS